MSISQRIDCPMRLPLPSDYLIHQARCATSMSFNSWLAFRNILKMVEFKQELKRAIESHYAKVRESFNDLYGYTLYTDDSLCSIGPVCNRESDITVPATDEMYRYYKYIAVEWANFDDFGIFDGVNSLLANIMDCDHPEWEERRQEVLEICLNTLFELDKNNLFGSKDSGRFIAICIADSNDPIMDRSAKLLNQSSVYEAYAKEFA